MHTLRHLLLYAFLTSFLFFGFVFVGIQVTNAQTNTQCSFTRDLTVGSRGTDVNCLQRFLKAEGHLSGNTTNYFGPITRSALADWQQAEGITPAEGYFGPISRQTYNQTTGNTVSNTPTNNITETVGNVRSQLQEQIRSLMQQVIALLTELISRKQDQLANQTNEEDEEEAQEEQTDEDQEESDDDEEDESGGGGGGSSSSDSDTSDSDSGDSSSDDSSESESINDSIQGDYDALMSFYNAMDGDSWDDNSGWESMTPETMGDAFGVVVYPDAHELAGRVKELNLSGYPTGRTDRGNVQDGAPVGNNVVGNSIPDNFGDLTKLTHLRLKGNDITARVDNWITGLKNAEWISLSGAVEYGGQDEINLYDLVRYNHPSKNDDSYNKFHGPLPNDLSMLDNLEMLEISHGDLTGELPKKLPDSIRAVFLQNNKMTGTLPDWSNAVNMTHLYLMNNNDSGEFTGTIPESWNNMTKMAWITLKNNNFDGPFPVMDKWTDLRFFGIGGSPIGGEFPFWLMTQDDKHRSLHTIEIGGTEFTGELPEDVSPHFNPSTFSIMDNNLTGNIPSWFEDQFKGIVQILWTGNNFSGEFPDVSDFSDLRFIEVAGNEFSGSLPEIDPNNGTLNIVSFHNNNFTGTIPDSWGQVVDGVFRRGMRIPGNEIEGKIPARLGEVVKNRFVVYDNKFVFADLIEVVEMLQSAPDFEDDRGIDFAPQKPFGDAKTITLSPGQTFNYDFSNKSHPDDSYQWTKDGSNISGETSASISISNVDASDAGEYRLEISNPFGSVEDGGGQTLGTLKSEPITLKVQ